MEEERKEVSTPTTKKGGKCTEQYKNNKNAGNFKTRWWTVNDKNIKYGSKILWRRKNARKVI